MFLLAAKLAFAMMGGEAQADRLTDHEKTVWNQYRSAIVTLYEQGHPSGVAALIDDSGYFVTHNSSVSSASITGKSSNGKELTFSVIDRDRATQLVLLKTTGWVAGTARPFRIPTDNEADGGGLLAVLPTGPIRASYMSRHRFGLLKTSRRLVTLTEIRFEASPQLVGGALILCENGEFIGALNATLDRPETLDNQGQNSQGGQTLNNTTPIISGPGVQVGPQNQMRQFSNQGPAEMTVAYTVGPEVVQHSLQGFLSPSHEAEYASLGIFCTDAIGGGAQIQKVTPGSPAAKSKLQPGDILMNINYHEIPDQVAFATVMLQQAVGKKITLVIKRGRSTVWVDIVPAKATN